jgi:hypothetical protein
MGTTRLRTLKRLCHTSTLRCTPASRRRHSPRMNPMRASAAAIYAVQSTLRFAADGAGK